jgi:hypothetical protein
MKVWKMTDGLITKIILWNNSYMPGFGLYAAETVIRYLLKNSISFKKLYKI